MAPDDDFFSLELTNDQQELLALGSGLVISEVGASKLSFTAMAMAGELMVQGSELEIAACVLIRLTPDQRTWLADEVGVAGEVLALSPHSAGFRESWPDDESSYELCRGRVTIRRHDASDIPPANEVTIRLDVGGGVSAWGTGRHTTTQLAAELLGEVLEDNPRVLDVGTGSGILALVALKLGAREVVAVDNDPVAVSAARRNFDLNDVGTRVELVSDLNELTAARFDLVIAAMYPAILVELCTQISRCTRVGGQLVISGVTATRIDEVAGAFEAQGFERIRTIEERIWAASALVRVDGK